MYSPTLGRFISQDPIGFDAGDVNLFRFVENNPPNMLDPDGLTAITSSKFIPPGLPWSPDPGTLHTYNTNLAIARYAIKRLKENKAEENRLYELYHSESRRQTLLRQQSTGTKEDYDNLRCAAQHKLSLLSQFADLQSDVIENAKILHNARQNIKKLLKGLSVEYPDTKETIYIFAPDVFDFELEFRSLPEFLTEVVD